MLRAMTLSDLEEVARIEAEVQTYPWTRGNFADALANAYICRVNDMDGRICSYAVLRPLAGEAELLIIGVTAEHQHKGLGRAMLQNMLDAARDLKMCRVFLEVGASNVAALALYRNRGFVEIGVRRGYYMSASGSENAITMACELMGETIG